MEYWIISYKSHISINIFYLDKPYSCQKTISYRENNFRKLGIIISFELRDLVN